MNKSEEIEDQMVDIIDDIDNWRYEDTELNEKEVIINDTELEEDTSQT